MLKEIICAGFGGQGVLTAGKIISYVAYAAGKKLTWFPSYGNEMRGGAANCNVIISDERIASPYADHPDIALTLNEPCIAAYEDRMKAGGFLFVNSSLVDEGRNYRADIQVIKIPATELAQKLSDERSANICMLGAMVRHADLFEKEVFEEGMCEYFEQQGKGKRNASNLEAFRAGYDYQPSEAGN